MIKSTDIQENYKRDKRGAKKTLNASRSQTFDGLCQSLHTNEGEIFISILAEGQERNKQKIICAQ